MRKTIIESLIIGLILVLTPTTVKSQLFEDNELFPKVKTIKGKYYNGTGSGRYWSLDYVDSIGRVIKKESYRNNQLMSRNEIEYDNHNNKILDVQTFDINNTKRKGTYKYEYKYAENRIVYQNFKLSLNDSTVIELIKNEGDSIYKYQEKAYYFRPKTGETAVYEKIYTLRYKNDLLISNEIFEKEDNSKEIKTYEYFDNGRLKRRTINRIPEPKIKGNYTGGPGSDDEYYKYNLDSQGRIKKFFRIINRKTYKIATYKYD
jgi:hypothetical protein